MKKLICKNCKLWNSTEKVCTVTVLKPDGEKYEIYTEPEDACHWEKLGIDVQEIKIWSDGKDGYIKTTNNI